MRLDLYQPDIPQNAGTMMRLAAALNIPLDLIEPCGFVLDDKRFRRAAMDYINLLDLTRHQSWENFYQDRVVTNKNRLILLSTKASIPYSDFTYQENDILMVGRESAGVPDSVHNSADHRVLIPMAQGLRSLNVAVSAGMVLGEALRQTNSFPDAIPVTG